jgi:hypothetical protein
MALELFDMGTLLDLCNYSNPNIKFPPLNYIFANAAVLETDGGAIPVVMQVFLQFCCHQKKKKNPLCFANVANPLSRKPTTFCKCSNAIKP